MDAPKLHPTPLPYTQVRVHAYAYTHTHTHTHTQLPYYLSHAAPSENANIAAYKQIVPHPTRLLTVVQINISQREPSGEKQKGKQVWEEWIQFLLERCSDRPAELRLGNRADFRLHPPTEGEARGKEGHSGSPSWRSNPQ